MKYTLLTALCSVVACSPIIADDGPLVRLHYATFDPLAEATLPTLPAIDARLRAHQDCQLYLVQLHGVSTDTARGAIEAAGGELLRFFTDHVHVVSASPRAINAIAALQDVRWVGANHPAYRLDDAASVFATHTHTESLAQRWSIEVYHDDGFDAHTVAKRVTDIGGTAHVPESVTRRFEATLSPAQLLEIIHMDEVSFIDAWGPGEPDMDIARIVMGSNFVQSGALNFSGQDVRGEVFDVGLCLTNPEWKHTPILHSSSAGTSITHGTPVYGIAFAQGLSPLHTGHLPEAQGIFFRYQESSQFGGPKTPLTIAQELVDPAGPYRAVFSTSSVGSPRTSQYTTISAEMDDVILTTDLLQCQSHSNSGNTQARPQSWAKNIVSAGAFVHNESTNPNTYSVSGSSTGPATDGRIKPDLAGFYDSVDTTTGCSGYGVFGGSSAATPMICAPFGAFYQMWHEGVWLGFGSGAGVFESRASAATAKAALINTATRPNTVSPAFNRNVQSWGLPDLERLYDERDTTGIIDNDDSVDNLQTKAYSACVAANTPELRVTLVYLDPPATVGAAQHRINDVSLRVMSPGGTVYTGNAGLIDANFSTPSTTLNDIDTVENVFINTPDTGTWMIEIIGSEIVVDTDPNTPGTNARFALWVAGIEGGTLNSPCAGCYADCDGSGSLNILDYICFGDDFAAGGSYADCDNSGSLNILDYICFGDAFAMGCP